MQVLYGTPLPPGLVAPTRGELRLRVDQLVLEDDVLNNNPLLQLFDAGAITPTSARQHRSSSAEGRLSGAASSTSSPRSAALSRSPNRFVVPVDYCAAGPIFWGERRPTAQGQPSTPQHHRPPLVMAYPIKIEPRQFAAYLQRMTASPQRGMQLDVFVPSSYSGRPAVTVGKASIALDTLQPGQPMQGWFPVVHRRPRVSLAAAGACQDSAAHSQTSTPSVETDGREIIVGKVRLTVSVEYYPTTRHASGIQEVVQQQPLQKRGSQESDRGTSPQVAMSHSIQRAMRHSSEAARRSEASASASAPPAAMELAHVLADDAQRHRASSRFASNSHFTQDRSSAAHDILQQGLRLRAQMELAARGMDVEGSQLSAMEGAAVDALRHKLNKEAEKADAAGAVVKVVDVESESTVYTSEESDEERFALQVQKDSEAREKRGAEVTTASSYQEVSMPAPSLRALDSFVAGTESVSGPHAARHGPRPASVELSFSNFSFAQTPATEDLHQLRFSLRLSRDVTTADPSAGPLSSYVHSVPINQSAICLHFDVRSFSEERSRLVVEAYKVVARSEVENDTDAWDARGPRQVAKEELLGLCVLGLYRQSREVVFRDPVLDCSNVYAQLELRMRRTPPHGRKSGGRRDGTDVAFVDPLHDGSRALLSNSPSNSPHHSQLVDVPGNTHHEEEEMRRTETTTGGGAAVARNVTQHPEVPAIYMETARTSAVVAAVSGTSERRRLRVVVYGAAELPKVALRTSLSGRPALRLPPVTTSPLALQELGVEGVKSFADPSTFVTVEEIFETKGAAAAQEKTCARKHSSIKKYEDEEDGTSVMSRARMEPMEKWCVEEARSGFFDRSVVIDRCANPAYDYEVVLQLREVELPACETSFSKSRRSNAEESVHFHGTPDVLAELQLNLWHSDHNLSETNVGRDTGGGKMLARKTEEAFWKAAAYMGTCRVDLRPLRYLPMINGYYRVVHERMTGGGVEGFSSAAEREANTVGHLRVGVSLI